MVNLPPFRFTSSFSASTGDILLGRGGCEPPDPKWKLKFPLASRRHCWFQFADDAIVVVDVSRGGTFINGTAVSRSKGTKLVKGDILSLVTPVTSITETETLDSKFCAFKVHINTSQLTSIQSDSTNPTDTLRSVTTDRPLVSFPIARRVPVATSSSSGYVTEAQDFLERAGVPPEQGARSLSAEPEPEEGPEENEKPEAAEPAEPQEPEQEYSDQQVSCVGIYVCRFLETIRNQDIIKTW